MNCKNEHFASPLSICQHIFTFLRSSSPRRQCFGRTVRRQSACCPYDVRPCDISISANFIIQLFSEYKEAIYRNSQLFKSMRRNQNSEQRLKLIVLDFSIGRCVVDGKGLEPLRLFSVYGEIIRGRGGERRRVAEPGERERKRGI